LSVRDRFVIDNHEKPNIFHFIRIVRPRHVRMMGGLRILCILGQLLDNSDGVVA
jgi:hypothetical protein